MPALMDTVDSKQRSKINRVAERGVRRPTKLQQRTESLLRREIAFIDNPSFREAVGADLSIELPRSGQGTQLESRQTGGHLLQLCRTDLLTAEEEKQLFHAYNFFKYQANAMRSSLSKSRASRKKLNEIDSLLYRAERVRNHLVKANVRLIMSIVKHFADALNSFDDVMSEGLVALMRSVEKFDYDRGFRFSTYATMVVRRHLGRVLASEHKRRTRYTTSLVEAFEVKAAPELDNAMAAATSSSTSNVIHEMIHELDQREQYIIRQRFSFDDPQAKRRTLASLANEMGVCKERVRQLEQRALKKMREMAHIDQLGRILDV